MAEMPSTAALREGLPRRQEWLRPRAYLRSEQLYRELFREGYTMLPARRARALFRLARAVESRGIPGDLVDCGVWNGGSSVLLAAGAPSRRVWAFDSFQGLPEPTRPDSAQASGRAGTLVGSEQKVREAFAQYADPEQLRIAAGWFADAFPAHAGEIHEVAVLHADGDWYESVLLTLETFYGAVAPGGYVVIDDYGGWPGAKRAVDEFRVRSRISEPLMYVDDSGCYWRKGSP